jgi:hypothetical protein
MSKSNIAELKRRVLEAEARAAYYEACYNCFWTGDMVESSTWEQLIMATWGRRRIEEKKKTAALLQATENNTK